MEGKERRRTCSLVRGQKMARTKTAVMGGARKLTTDWAYSNSLPLFADWMIGIHRMLTTTSTRTKTLRGRFLQ